MVHLWSRLKQGMTPRLVLYVCVLTLLTVLAVVTIISTLMRQRIYHTTDVALSHNANLVQIIIEHEESHLAAEAAIISWGTSFSRRPRSPMRSRKPSSEL